MHKNKNLLAAAAAPVLLLGAVSAQAALLARDLDGAASTTEAYYDTELNITWLADAGLAIPGLNNAGGTYNGGDLETLAGLTLYGTTGWRAPAVLDTNCSTSPASCAEPGPNATELAHLWQVTLGNAVADPLGPNANAGPFRNVYPTGPLVENGHSVFWLQGRTGTQTVTVDNGNGKPVTYTWDTYLQQTLWEFGGPGTLANVPQYQVAKIWLVHDGDIAAVPEPGTYACVGLGLVAAFAARRFRRG